MEDSPEDSNFFANSARMSGKSDENSPIFSSGPECGERKARQLTFDVYVGRIPAEWNKVCI